MKRVFKFLFILTLCMGFYQTLNAAYLKNVPQTIKQPDGTIIKCFATGDEFHNWLHDANNYTIIKEQDGYYYYAQLEGERLVASDYQVGKTYLKSTNLIPGVNISGEKIREKRRNKLNGRPNYQRMSSLKATSDELHLNNIVLYIRFSDEQEFSSDTTFYYNMLNNETADYNSMYNYYQTVSYGKAFIKSHFYPTPTANTIISYQDTKPRGYFQPYNATDNPDGYDPEVDSIRRIREFDLLERALIYFNANYTIPASIDLDYNSDGFLDNISFVIKGDAEGWSDLLWPHNWALYDRVIRINGIRVLNFNFLLETVMNDRGVGVLAHEMGHAIGYPDLYHYDEESTIDPVGMWDIMGTTKNPPQGLGAYLKHHVSGWIDTIPEITEAGTYTLQPVASDTNNVYKIASPYSTKEYFIIEYRRKEGTFESSLPQSGLIIYRINEDAVTYRGGGNADGPPDELYVYRPGGTPTNNGTLSEAAFSRDDSFDNTTNPTPFLQNGGAGGLYISNITTPRSTVSFDVDFRPDALYANFIANKTQANIREEVQFTNQSAGSPTALEWTFEGGIPASFTGASPPAVIYPDTGSFSVTLSVTSAEGTSIETKADFITIVENPGTIPPENLASSATGNDIVLNWTAPSLTGAEFTLQWDDGNNAGSGIGLGADPSSFDILSHWTPSQLANFDDMFLTEISFYAFNGKDNPTVKDYSLRVYAGVDAATLVIDEEILAADVSLGQWNTFTLATPHQIDASTDLWFGANNDSGTEPSGAPFGIDNGPALVNQGDVLFLDGTLSTLSANDLDNNWNLAGTVVNTGENAKSAYILKNAQSILKSITGYNVYRNELKINATLVTATNYTDTDVPDGDYTYYTTTVFTEGESTPSNKIEISVSNGTVGIDDLPVEEVSIYPNPVNNKLTVALGELRNQDIVVKIIDQNGRLVYSLNESTSDDRLEIYVNYLSSGVYTLHLIGEELIYQAKFIIAR